MMYRKQKSPKIRFLVILFKMIVFSANSFLYEWNRLFVLFMSFHVSYSNNNRDMTIKTKHLHPVICLTGTITFYAI